MTDTPLDPSPDQLPAVLRDVAYSLSSSSQARKRRHLLQAAAEIERLQAALSPHPAAPLSDAQIDDAAGDTRIAFGHGAGAFNDGVDALADTIKRRLAAPQAPTAALAPAALNWTAAPNKTQWGAGMMVAVVALDKDSTFEIYAHCDDAQKVATALGIGGSNDDWRAAIRLGATIVESMNASAAPVENLRQIIRELWATQDRGDWSECFAAEVDAVIATPTAPALAPDAQEEPS